MEEKKYQCETCGSESAGKAGVCCEKERAEVCASCGEQKTPEGKCPVCDSE